MDQKYRKLSNGYYQGTDGYLYDYAWQAASGDTGYALDTNIKRIPYGLGTVWKASNGRYYDTKWEAMHHTRINTCSEAEQMRSVGKVLSDREVIEMAVAGTLHSYKLA